MSASTRRSVNVAYAHLINLEDEGRQRGGAGGLSLSTYRLKGLEIPPLGGSLQNAQSALTLTALEDEARALNLLVWPPRSCGV